MIFRQSRLVYIKTMVPSVCRYPYLFVIIPSLLLFTDNPCPFSLQTPHLPYRNMSSPHEEKSHERPAEAEKLEDQIPDRAGQGDTGSTETDGDPLSDLYNTLAPSFEGPNSASNFKTLLDHMQKAMTALSEMIEDPKSFDGSNSKSPETLMTDFVDFLSKMSSKEGKN